jgi:hypothetical protein
LVVVGAVVEIQTVAGYQVALVVAHLGMAVILF